jgi:hypothetical protein
MDVTFRYVATIGEHAPPAAMENITPARRALRALDRPAPPAGEGPPKRISKKVRTGINALVSGDCKTIAEAAAKAGIARESLSRALSVPHVARHLHERVSRHLAIMAARAGAVKGELLDSDNEMVRDRSSSFVLGLAGIAPATTPGVAVNLEIKAGYVIDLSDHDPRRPGVDIGMRIVSPTVYSPPAIDADLDQDSAE